jgi:Tfp pilus assembly protein PilW
VNKKNKINFYGKNKFSRGFSLMELLIYIFIATIVTLAVVSIFLSIQKGRGQAESRAEVNSNLRFATDKISQDIRSASAVITPDLSQASSTLKITLSDGNVTYCLKNGKLRREAAGGLCTESSAAITADDVLVQSISFTRLENTNTILSKTLTSIVISLTMSYNSASPDWQYSSAKKTTVSLMNL